MEVAEGAAKARKRERGKETENGQPRDRNAGRDGAFGGVIRVAEGQVATVDRREQGAAGGVCSVGGSGRFLHADLGTVWLTMRSLFAWCDIWCECLCCYVLWSAVCGLYTVFARFGMESTVRSSARREGGVRFGFDAAWVMCVPVYFYSVFFFSCTNMLRSCQIQRNGVELLKRCSFSAFFPVLSPNSLAGDYMYLF